MHSLRCCFSQLKLSVTSLSLHLKRHLSFIFSLFCFGFFLLFVFCLSIFVLSWPEMFVQKIWTITKKNDLHIFIRYATNKECHITFIVVCNICLFSSFRIKPLFVHMALIYNDYSHPTTDTGLCVKLWIDIKRKLYNKIRCSGIDIRVVWTLIKECAVHPGHCRN